MDINLHREHREIELQKINKQINESLSGAYGFIGNAEQNKQSPNNESL